jgi:hypothetical protein
MGRITIFLFLNCKRRDNLDGIAGGHGGYRHVSCRNSLTIYWGYQAYRVGVGYM